MKRPVVAFDMDDTLIVPAIATGLDIDVPNYETIAVYRWFQAQGCEMWIWSGGGEDYARRWADKLGLEPDRIVSKFKQENGGLVPDIAFDDAEHALGVVNVKVRRINNHIVRYPDRVAAKGAAQ